MEGYDPLASNTCGVDLRSAGVETDDWKEVVDALGEAAGRAAAGAGAEDAAGA